LVWALRLAVGGTPGVKWLTARFSPALQIMQSLYIQYTAFYGFHECNYSFFKVGADPNALPRLN
jgi:hypothetical protein